MQYCPYETGLAMKSRGNRKKVDKKQALKRASGNALRLRQATDQRVASALRAVREGASVSRAARENGLSFRTLRRRADDALLQDRAGARIRATKDDHLPRHLLIAGSHGPREIEVRGLKAAREFARYQAAVNRFLRGDGNALAEWHGK